MVNQMVPRPLAARTRAALALFLLQIVALGGGCSTLGRSLPGDHELPFEGANHPRIRPQPLWKQEIEGKLTDLAVASESGHILVTQVLDGQGPGNTVVSLRERSGKILWTSALDSPVRAQSISSNGDWVVVGTYEDELIRLDVKNGKKLWTVKESGMCRPIILEKSGQVLCHHDDDAIPGVAFSIFDAKGASKLKFNVPQDLLVLKVAPDESKIVLGMVKGGVWVLSGAFKKVSEHQLDGEIVDLAVSGNGGPAAWSALVNVNGVGQKLISMNAQGTSSWEQLLDSPHQQVEISLDGRNSAIYGNGPRGQAVSLWSLAPNQRLMPLWSYRAPRYADYNQQIDLTGDETLLGFEEVTERTRHSHVVALRKSGELDWDIPLLSEDGAYLYARGVSSRARLVVVGTDDGSLSAFEIAP